MSAAGGKLSRLKERAIAALLACPTITAAARRAGCSERVLRKWLKQDAGFRQGYQEARTRFLELSLGRLLRASGRAVSRLGRLVNAADARVALAASVAVLDRAAKGVETLDLAERVARLEEAARRLQDLEIRLRNSNGRAPACPS